MIKEATILEVDFEQGFTVRTDTGEVHIVGRIAVPCANLFHFGAMAKVPEPGDGALLVDKQDGSKFIIPMYITKLHYDTDLKMDVKDFRLIIEEFALKPGDYFILTSDLEGAFILRTSGMFEFRSGDFYIKHNPDIIHGGLKILTGNIQINTAKGGFSFSYVHDDNLGVSVNEEIKDFPSSLAPAPIFTFSVSRGKQKYLTVSVDRITGDVAIESDIWKMHIRYAGIFEFQAGPTSMKLDIAGNINISTTGTVNIRGAKINLGMSPGFSALLTETFLTLFNSHTHQCSSPGSPSTPPITPITPSAVGSQSIKISP